MSAKISIVSQSKPMVRWQLLIGLQLFIENRLKVAPS